MRTRAAPTRVGHGLSERIATCTTPPTRAAQAARFSPASRAAEFFKACSTRVTWRSSQPEKHCAGNATRIQDEFHHDEQDEQQPGGGELPQDALRIAAFMLRQETPAHQAEHRQAGEFGEAERAPTNTGRSMCMQTGDPEPQRQPPNDSAASNMRAVREHGCEGRGGRLHDVETDEPAFVGVFDQARAFS